MEVKYSHLVCPHTGCDHVNPMHARFCARCGRPLENQYASDGNAKKASSIKTGSALGLFALVLAVAFVVCLLIWRAGQLPAPLFFGLVAGSWIFVGRRRRRRRRYW